MSSTDIFARLKENHDRHRALLGAIDRTATGSDHRTELFEEFTIEVKAYASAEEQALYSTMMRKPETTDETRHSVAEHHELEELLNDLAATDPLSSEWQEKYQTLRHDYLHHIEEEEDEHFPDFAQYLSNEDEVHMRMVFDRRKSAEQADATVTPEALEDAKS